jgi:transposase-like protein
VLGKKLEVGESKPISVELGGTLPNRLLRIVTDRLRAKLPKHAAMMDQAEHEVLTFMDFPKDHPVKIHSKKVLERLDGAVKRRADVVGIFPNESAIRRLVRALLVEQNEEYAIQKRYMNLESLALLSENPPIRLLALA